MNIRIKNNLRKRKLPTAELKNRLAFLLLSTGVPDAELSVFFVGDRLMRTINRIWRHIDRTTDVLSFAQREGTFLHIQPQVLGDIVVCLPQAERQARTSGVHLDQEINRLIVHGLLHLLGYDHEKSQAEAIRMRRKERYLLSRISR